MERGNLISNPHPWAPGTWTINYTHFKLWDEITYPFPNFNSFTIEVWEWISNFIPHFSGHAITYPCRDLSWTRLVKGATHMRCFGFVLLEVLSKPAWLIYPYSLIWGLLHRQNNFMSYCLDRSLWILCGFTWNVTLWCHIGDKSVLAWTMVCAIKWIKVSTMPLSEPEMKQWV